MKAAYGPMRPGERELPKAQAEKRTCRSAIERQKEAARPLGRRLGGPQYSHAGSRIKPLLKRRIVTDVPPFFQRQLQRNLH